MNHLYRLVFVICATLCLSMQTHGEQVRITKDLKLPVFYNSQASGSIALQAGRVLTLTENRDGKVIATVSENGEMTVDLTDAKDSYEAIKPEPAKENAIQPEPTKENAVRPDLANATQPAKSEGQESAPTPAAANSESTAEDTVIKYSAKLPDFMKTADFTLWQPPSVKKEGKARAVLLLLPGNNGSWLTEYQNPQWQEFAEKEKVIIVGACLQQSGERSYEQNPECWELIIKSIKTMLPQAGYSGAEPPLLLYGFSSGGNVSSGILATYSKRVVAAVLIKSPSGVRTPDQISTSFKIPVIINTGGQDKEKRVSMAYNSFLVGTSNKAPWAYALRQSAGHDTNGTRELAIPYFSGVMALRLKGGNLSDINSRDGGFVDKDTNTYYSYKDFSGKKDQASWMPDEASAAAFKTYCEDK